MHETAPLHLSLCPLCGGDNRCAMETERETGEPQPPCWCVNASFDPGLIARLPKAAQGKACICARCVAQHATAPDRPGALD